MMDDGAAMDVVYNKTLQDVWAIVFFFSGDLKLKLYNSTLLYNKSNRILLSVYNR